MTEAEQNQVCRVGDMVSFEIPEENLERFKARMDQLLRKAAKLGLCANPEIPPGEPGCSPGYKIGEPRDRVYKVVDEFSDMYQDGSGNWQVHYITFIVVVYTVIVWGSAPKFAGWEFLATVDYDEEGAPPIFRAVAGKEIPERYRESGPVCEHCRKIRSRKSLFILGHEDGRILQVGRSCLKDFLGHPSPEQIASAAELIRECMSGWSESHTPRPQPAVRGYLAWVSSVIRQFGWTPRSKAADDIGRQATASVASQRMWETYYARGKKTNVQFPMPVEADLQAADAALAWARGLGSDGAKLSDYELNLKAAASREGVGKNEGLIASMLPAWGRATGALNTSSTSGWLGQPGERLRDIVVIVDRVIEVDGFRDASNALILMHDQQGNKLVWKSTTGGMTQGGTYKLTGTVDKKRGHDTYVPRRGGPEIKQTRVKNCKVEKLQFKPTDATIQGQV